MTGISHPPRKRLARYAMPPLYPVGPVEKPRRGGCRTNGLAPSDPGSTIPGMAQNFIDCDREQELLLPPSLREWLPEHHLAWFVIDAVAEMDLEPFYSAYRADGWGRAAFDPQMMVALLLYAYALGERSARKIERRCSEDVAFRVICANRVPDHATIARCRGRHEQALADTFTQVRATPGPRGRADGGPSSRNRGQGALPKTPAAGRAGLRRHQVQSPRRPLHA